LTGVFCPGLEHSRAVWIDFLARLTAPAALLPHRGRRPADQLQAPSRSVGRGFFLPALAVLMGSLVYPVVSAAGSAADGCGSMANL